MRSTASWAYFKVYFKAHVYVYASPLAMYVHKCKSGRTPDPDRRIVRSETRLKKDALDFAAFIISLYNIIN